MVRHLPDSGSMTALTFIGGAVVLLIVAWAKLYLARID
jgi:hypothetical protein